MIKSVVLGEEIVIATKNKVGLLADIASTMAANGINIEAVAGYQAGASGARVLLVTNANLIMVRELKKKNYKVVKEAEVILAELENRPGALKIVTSELKKNKIDIKHMYVTSPATGGSSRMVLQTGDNETAMAILAKYTGEEK